MRQDSEIFFKCRGHYIGGGKLLNRRNTPDVKRCSLLGFTLNRGSKNDGGLLVRWIPVQQQDGVID